MSTSETDASRYLIYSAIALSTIVFMFVVADSITQAAQRPPLEHMHILTGSVLPLLITSSLLIREHRVRNTILGISAAIALVIIGLSAWLAYGPPAA